MAGEVKVVPLEPCPFCGSSNVNHRYIRDGQQMFCQDCGGSARPAFHGPKDDTIARAAAAWNRRAPTDEDPTTPITRACERCQGNGEIVTDWDRYIHAHGSRLGDEAVADCPDCDGTGRAADPTTPEAQAAPCAVECQYAKDVDMWPEHRCADGCQYAKDAAAQAIWDEISPQSRSAPASYDALQASALGAATRDDLAMLVGRFPLHTDDRGDENMVLHDAFAGGYDDRTEAVYQLVDDLLAQVSVSTSPPDATYWKGAYERMAARNVEFEAERNAPTPAVKRMERWQVPARELDATELEQEFNFAADKFDNRGEHGGSPGEFWAERMDEIEAERKRRKLPPATHNEAQSAGKE